MLPNFLVEETTVRESGHSAVFNAQELSDQSLAITFGITHAVENETIEIDIHGSYDGVNWASEPLARFAPKSWCGTYRLTLPRADAQYLRAAWRVSRWSSADNQPFFRIYLFAEAARVRAMATAGAA